MTDPDPPVDPSRRAAREVDDQVKALVADGESFVVETVLSTVKYQSVVDQGRAKGLLFRLVYVITMDSILNVERVQARVKQGGHNVPEDQIHQRWQRSLELLPWFAERADKLIVLDNSDEFVPIALRRFNQKLTFTGTMLDHPALARLQHLSGTFAI